MVKQVSVLSGTVFKTLKAAKIYYGNLRKDTPPGMQISEPNRSNLLDIYSRYCAATKYKVEDAIEVTTEWDNQQRQTTSTYTKTKAFAVLTPSGARIIFSIDKALETIAT